MLLLQIFEYQDYSPSVYFSCTVRMAALSVGLGLCPNNDTVKSNTHVLALHNVFTIYFYIMMLKTVKRLYSIEIFRERKRDLIRQTWFKINNSNGIS